MSGGGLPYGRLSSFYFFYFALLGTWLPFWALYLASLGFNERDIGYLSALVMATKIVAPSIWGWLADYSDRRTAIIRLGAVLATVAFAGIFIRQDFWWLALVVVAYSFFWNAVLAQFEVVTLSHLGERYEYYSQIRLWGSVGFIIAVTGFGVFFDQLGIALLPWVIIALLALLAVSSFSVAERRGAQYQHSEQDQQGFIAILRRPAVIAFFAMAFLLQLSHGPYYTYFSLYLEGLGYSTTVTGIMWSLGVVVEVLLFVVVHQVLRRYSLRGIMAVSLVLTALRWILIAYCADIWPVLVFAQCLHAASFASFHAVAVEFIRRQFYGHQGQGMALYSGLSYGAGGAVGALLAAWLWPYSEVLSFVSAAVITLVSLWLCMAYFRGNDISTVSRISAAEVNASREQGAE